MKKINYKCCIFICIALLIVSGLFSRPLLANMKSAVVGILKDHSITGFISKVDEAANELSYKGPLLDLYSLYYRVMDVRLVEKPDKNVIRMENNYLIREQDALDAATLEEIGDRFVDLKNLADSIDADFLYVMAPAKPYFEKTPEGTNDTQQEHTAYAGILKEKGIPLLDLAEQMMQQSIVFEDAYFITDHHWIPETGFWAARQILQAANNGQLSPSDEAICDLKNYDIKVYQNWFLGSIGKKVGRYFTPLGVDDISIITPKFDTSLTVSDTRGTQTGSFKDTLIDMSHMNPRDYYGKNPYAAYSGGDFGLQVIQNHNAPDNAKRIVIIRDSFACCVTPFMALGAEEVHSVDIRYWKGTETAESIPEYIKEVNPDCVIVLYSSATPDKADFFK